MAVLILILGQRLTTLQNINQLPRTITSQQKDAFIGTTKILPKGKVRVIYNPPEKEVFEYAESVLEMLDSAGFDTGNTISQGIGGRPKTGVVLVVGDREHPPAHLEIVATALRHIGIESEIDEDSHMRQYNPELVEVIVGNRKPN